MCMQSIVMYFVVNVCFYCVVSQLDQDAGECIICLEDMVVGEKMFCTCAANKLC